jgi:hypothetical protein
MARVNGKKRELARLEAKLERFKAFRELYPTFTPSQIDGTERRIKAVEETISEL